MKDEDNATKVLHIITGLRTGGAEMMLGKVLSKTKYPSMVLCLGGNEETPIARQIEKNGIKIVWLNLKNPAIFLTSILNTMKTINMFSPTVVQGWMYHGNIISLAFKLFSKKTSVFWNVRHSLYDIKSDKYLTRIVIKLNAYLSRFADNIIYNSTSSSIQHERYGFSADKTVVIPNGFELKMFSKNIGAIKKIKHELNINTYVIGCVARYHPTKGHDVFINAAKLLDKKKPYVKYLLIGKGLDNNNDKLVKQLKLRGLYNKFILLGERSDIAILTSVFDIATSPSYSEAFSNTIGEAMASSVPCVVTDVGDSSWIVGKSGIVVPSSDPQAMSDAWEKLLSIGNSERIIMGENALDRIKKYFSLDIVVSKYDDLYCKD